MSVCASCRMALRQRLLVHNRRSMSSKASSTAHQILSKPTWSIRSLLPSTAATAAAAAEPVTPAQLRHLLRLAALPLPRCADEERSMIATLQSQLQFVRAIQRVDTSGVEPLRAIRDATGEGVRETAVGLDALRDVLARETLVGHYKRPKRVKEKVTSESENWDVMSTASRKAGNYFVVQSKKDGDEGVS